MQVNKVFMQSPDTSEDGNKISVEPLAEERVTPGVISMEAIKKKMTMAIKSDYEQSMDSHVMSQEQMIKKLDARFKSHIKSLPLNQVSKGKKSLSEIPYDYVKNL
jgi:hypothetical protein